MERAMDTLDTLDTLDTWGRNASPLEPPAPPAPPVWLGIDVGKHELVLATSEVASASWSVANDAAGWAAVLAWCQATPPAGIVLEATGGYEAGVVYALDAAGFTPVVANPLAVRRFAQSGGRHGKTDRLDARLLAEYGRRMTPVAQPVPDETARKLRALIARREQLTEQLVAEQNRLQQATALVRPLISAHLDWLRRARDEVTALVASDPYWQGQVALLETVPGFGPWIATVFAVELPELGERTGKQLAALVGVAPYPQDSGQRQRPRFIKGGRACVRRAGFQGMHAAQQARDPVLRSYVARLMARGKTRKQALIAALRRVLGIVHVMVRDGLTWDQTEVGQGRFLPQSA